MDWRRGLFRPWIVGAALFVMAVASISYSGIKAESAESEAVTSTAEQEEVLSILAEFRERYPQYNDLSDAQLAGALELPLSIVLEPSAD